MSLRDIAQNFMVAWETQDWDTMSALMADDFIFVGATPQPLDKRRIIADTKARWAAFPDWKYNFHILEEQGDTVKLTLRNTGTHTGTLIAPVPGMPPVPPTGRAVSLPTETGFMTIRGNKIVQLRMETGPDGGFLGIMRQLGVNVPS